ncbi:hypothetical protein K502DRAFT_329181 [Neoconidiobolus thromboides FSU 785]|nr:hypothetical protein K502DRAFT_329181 [Neoconidiobolus thromboides FSU 785]
MSCDYCRKRKIRCDKARPNCLGCVNKGIECHYTPPLKRGPKGARSLNISYKGRESGSRSSSRPPASSLVNILPAPTYVNEIKDQRENHSLLCAEATDKYLNQDDTSLRYDNLNESTNEIIPMPSNSSSIQEKMTSISVDYQELIHKDSYLANLVYIFINEIFSSDTVIDVFQSIDKFIMTYKTNKKEEYNSELIHLFLTKVDHYITEMVTFNLQICKKLPSFPLFQGSILSYLKYIEQIEKPFSELYFHFETHCKPRLAQDQLSDPIFTVSYTINNFLAYILPKVYLKNQLHLFVKK